MRIHDINELPEHMRSRAAAELAKQSPAAPAPKPGKYRNQPIVVDGERFASKLEHACHIAQLARVKTGELIFTLRQISFPLPGGVVYRCDNFNLLRSGGAEVIDAKGTLTKEFVIKAKQMKSVYGIEVLLWTRRSVTPFSQRLNRPKRLKKPGSNTPAASASAAGA